MVDRRRARRSIAWAAFAVVVAVGSATRVPALILSGGPVYSLPGGGSCFITGVTSQTGGATITCTGVDLTSHSNVYFGLRGDMIPNGNTMTGSDPAPGLESVYRIASATAGSITYTSITSVSSASVYGTDTVSNNLILTLVGGSATLVATGGTPADSDANGDIAYLFHLTGGTTFVFRAAVTASDTSFPEGAACPALYDPVHAVAGAEGDHSQVSLAFYYSDCGDGVIDSPEQCDGGVCCTASCTYRVSGTVCRAAADVCDTPESCDGSTSTCPADAKMPSGVVCRAAAPGICDVAETCDGITDTCPPDALLPLEDLGYVTTVNAVALLDTESRTRCGTVELPESPSYVALAPDGMTVYATAESAAVYLVDTATRTLRAVVPGDPRFAGVAFSPEGDVVYALRSRFMNGPISSISLIDPERAVVTRNIPLFSEPLTTEIVTRLAIRADGQKAYVPLRYASGNRFDVTVVDLERNRVETTIAIPCGEEMIDLAFGPGGRLLYIPVVGAANCGETSGVAAAVSCPGDCNGDGVVAVNEIVVGVRIASGESPITACRAASGSDTVTISDLLRAVNSLLSGCNPTPTPTSGPVGGGNFTAVIDTEQQTLFEVIPLGNAGTSGAALGGAAGQASMVSGLGIAVSPDGQSAYVTRCGDGVCVLDLVRKTVVGSVAVRGLPYNIDLTRDGRTAYVTELASETVRVINLDDGIVTDSIAVPQPYDVVIRP